MESLLANEAEIQEIHTRIKGKQSHLSKLEKANEKLNNQINCINKWLVTLSTKPTDISDQEVILPSFDNPPPTGLIIDYANNGDHQVESTPISLDQVNGLLDIIATLQQAILVYSARISPLLADVQVAAKAKLNQNFIPTCETFTSQLNIKQMFAKEYLSNDKFIEFLERLELDEFPVLVAGSEVESVLNWDEIEPRSLEARMNLENLSAECSNYLDLVEKYIS